MIVAALPFHRWVLSPIAEAFMQRGAVVRWYRHLPTHPTDWMTTSPVATRDLAGFHGWADVAIVAEYPYAPLRSSLGCPIVGTRHSLASRKNTWAQEHEEADWIVTWSEWDEGMFMARGIAPYRGFHRAGCVWMATAMKADRQHLREMTRMCMGVPEAMVVWAPTLDPELSCRDDVVRVMCGLPDDKIKKVVRVHGATAWREREWLRELRTHGFLVLTGDDDPVDLMAAADVVISDVSGIALYAALMPDGPELIQIDAPTPTKTRYADKMDPDGPEWTERDSLGIRCPCADGLDEAIEKAIGWSLDGGSPYDETRSAVAEKMLGETSETTPEYAAALIEGAIR